MKFIQRAYLYIKYIYLKKTLPLDRFVSNFNTKLKLPRLLRMTKVGLITTFVSLVLGTTIVSAQEISNLDRFMGVGGEGWWHSWAAAGNGMFTDQYIEDSTTGEIEVQEGVLTQISSLQAGVYSSTDQVSATRYIASTLEDASIIPPVQAQASGYVTLQPILEIWKVSRNIALTFMTAIGFIIALMILLRVRSGQGMVTIMNSLPKIIAAIILIIFSYAIGGLGIDLGNVLTKFVVSKGTFLNATFIDMANYDDQIYEYGYPMDARDALLKYDPSLSISQEYWRTMNIFRLMNSMTRFSEWSPSCAARPEGCKIVDIIKTPTGYDIIDNTQRFLSGLGSVPNVLLEFVLNIYLAIVSFKVFFMLVQAFAELVIRIIGGPLQFITVAFSGFQVVQKWITGLLADSLVFPVTFLMLFIGAYLSGQHTAPWWISPDANVTFEHAPELLSHSVTDPSFIGNLIGIGILIMVPNVKKLLEQQLTIQPIDTGEAVSGLRGVVHKIPGIGAAAQMLGI